MQTIAVWISEINNQVNLVGPVFSRDEEGVWHHFYLANGKVTELPAIEYTWLPFLIAPSQPLCTSFFSMALE